MKSKRHTKTLVGVALLLAAVTSEDAGADCGPDVIICIMGGTGVPTTPGGAAPVDPVIPGPPNAAGHGLHTGLLPEHRPYINHLKDLAQEAYRRWKDSRLYRHNQEKRLHSYRKKTQEIVAGLQRDAEKLVDVAESQARGPALDALAEKEDERRDTQKRLDKVAAAAEQRRQELARQRQSFPDPPPAVTAEQYQSAVDPTHPMQGRRLQTKPESEHWHQLVEADRYHRAARAHLATVTEHVEERRALVDTADVLIDAADQQYAKGDAETGGGLLETALAALDMVFDFIPGASLVKDIVSVYSGINPITREQVSTVEKALIIGGLVLPGAVKGAGKVVAKAAKVLAELAGSAKGTAKYADEMLDVIRKSDDELRQFVGNTPCPR